MEAFENFLGDRLEGIERNQFLALHQTFESFNPRLKLNLLERHGPGGSGQRDASAVSDSNNQQRQILHVRLMKARNKAFHAHAELVSYLSLIHLILLSRSFSTTSGDFGISAPSFQKTPPSQPGPLPGRATGVDHRRMGRVRE